MNTRSILEGISFMNLIVLIIAISYSLFSNQMETILLDDMNSKIEIGFFYNCSLIFSKKLAFNYTIARNSCLYLDMKELSIHSYKGKIFNFGMDFYLNESFLDF